MRMRVGVLPLGVAMLALFGACGSERSADPPAPPARDAPTSAWQGLPGARLEALAPARSARTTHFMTSDECAFCHAAEPGSTALRDASGRDVSPSTSWRASMMALSARDPYYLAVLEHEIAAHPGAEATVMTTCTRCHAPAANLELRGQGKTLAYTELTHGTSSETAVGRDGVTCSVCHQIQPTNLGSSASFTGAFIIDDSRRIFGPHAAPLAGPMQMRVDYTPVASAHMTESGLCGSCHTVVTRSLDAQGTPTGPEVLEQGPFVEWSVSSFARAGGKTCQGCHVPTEDDDGATISTILSTRPANRLSPRSPVGRHQFVGANAFMLRILSRERAWAGFDPSPEELLEQADRAEANLRSAAKLAIAGVTREGATLVLRVRVENLTGHKLPTAYPSRRMWLHVRVLDDSNALVFESGGHRDGRIIDAQGRVLDAKGVLLPHRRVVSSAAEVQVWEAVPGDADGGIAKNLLDATGYLKDDRILPAGFDAADPRARLALPRGVEDDVDFGPGADEIVVRVENAPAAVRAEIALLYQTTRPSELELLAEHPGPAALRFLDMVGPDAMKPIVLAHTTTNVP
jgi:hypothetical protein